MPENDKVTVDAGAVVDCGHRRACLFDGERAVDSASLDGGATVRRDTSASAAVSLPELLTVRALTSARARYFERHVLAWYALGRVQEARAASAAVCEIRRRVADMGLDPLPSFTAPYEFPENVPDLAARFPLHVLLSKASPITAPTSMPRDFSAASCAASISLARSRTVRSSRPSPRPIFAAPIWLRVGSQAC